MPKSICKRYIAHLKKMGRTYDQAALRVLEDRRSELHYKVMKALDRAGIEYSDRFEATEIAHRIAKG